MKLTEVLNTNKDSNSKLQIDCINFLHQLFVDEKIKNLTIDNYFYLGVRGIYENKENYCVCFWLNYLEHKFEFFLSYDQLEYYISKENKILKECNLEDFTEDNILLEKFINYLRNDMRKMKIKIN